MAPATSIRLCRRLKYELCGGPICVCGALCSALHYSVAVLAIPLGSKMAAGPGPGAHERACHAVALLLGGSRLPTSPERR
jgi:hypothetical protein